MDNLTTILESCKVEIENAETIKQMYDIRVRYLGKSGELTTIMRTLKDLPNEEKPIFGKKVNDVRVELEGLISAKEAVLKESEKLQRIKCEYIDITEPAKLPKTGNLHPISKVRNEIIEIFRSLGFEMRQGPEIETDYFNFQLLNIPKDHPARDMQDTFYFNDNILLRTHTSPCQARTMQAKKPPIRMICPGKVYRRDDDDATHSHQFMQFEGLVVDKDITMSDLKGTLSLFIKKMFGEERNIRFKPSYFPFTEPSVEVDVSCFKCGGKGCSMCKKTGWIEILGAGMVHPNVLKAAGYDPEVMRGFAFGIGIERVAMLRHGIDDIRHLYTNDVRFLKQFERGE